MIRAILSAGMFILIVNLAVPSRAAVTIVSGTMSASANGQASGNVSNTLPWAAPSTTASAFASGLSYGTISETLSRNNGQVLFSSSMSIIVSSQSTQADCVGGSSALIQEDSTEIVRAEAILTHQTPFGSFSDDFKLLDSNNVVMFDLFNSSQLVTLTPGQYTLQWSLFGLTQVGHGGLATVDFNMRPVPEPCSASLIGLVWLASRRSRRRADKGES